MSTRTGVLSDLVREHELSDTAAAILILSEEVAEEVQALRGEVKALRDQLKDSIENIQVTP